MRRSWLFCAAPLVALLLIVVPAARADVGLLQRTGGAPAFANAGAVAAGPDGNVYVLDGQGDQPQRVRRFDPALRETGPWPVGGATFLKVSDLVVDALGDVYVAGPQGVQKFAPDGTPINTAWSSQPTAWLAAPRAGGVYTNDTGPITVRAADGTAQRTLPGSPSGSLAVSQAGDVYQSAGNSVSHLDPAGRPLAQIGSTPDRGPRPAAFAAGPGALAVDAGGHLWVTDRLGQRLDLFDRNGSFIGACGARSLGSDFTPNDVATGPGGRVYVVQPHQLDAFGPGAAKPCDDIAPKLGQVRLARRATDRHPAGVRRWRLTVTPTETTTLHITPWRRSHDTRCAHVALTPSRRTLNRGNRTIDVTARTGSRCNLHGVTLRAVDRAGNATTRHVAT